MLPKSCGRHKITQQPNACRRSGARHPYDFDDRGIHTLPGYTDQSRRATIGLRRRSSRLGSPPPPLPGGLVTAFGRHPSRLAARRRTGPSEFGRRFAGRRRQRPRSAARRVNGPVRPHRVIGHCFRRRGPALRPNVGRSGCGYAATTSPASSIGWQNTAACRPPNCLAAPCCRNLTYPPAGSRR